MRFLTTFAPFLFLFIRHTNAKEIIISSIIEEPFLTYNSDGKFEGFSNDLATELSKQLNFDYKIKLVPDGFYGQLNSSTRAWSGMVGELVSKKADMVIAPLTITSQRAEVIHFSSPFMSVSFSLLMRKAPSCNSHYMFLYPMESNLWIVSLLAVLVLLAALIIEQKIHRKEFKLYDFLRQDSTSCSGTLGSKLMKLSLAFLLIFLFASYVANYSAERSKGDMCHPTISSLEDLVSQRDIKYGFLTGGSTENYFKNSKRTIHQRLVNFITADKSQVNNYEEGIERVRGGELVFIMESPKAEFLISQYPCDLVAVTLRPDQGPTKGFGIAVPNDSTLKNQVNIEVLKLQENGIIEQLVHKWWKENGQCSGTNNKKADKQLTLENTAGIFYIFTTWLILAIFVSFLESRMNSKRPDEITITKEPKDLKDGNVEEGTEMLK